MKKYFYSEIFHSIQGEGYYTGKPTAWLRFFSCNLQCNGFGQKDPTDPSTYILPYKDIDLSKYSSLEELPVFEYGCDSSYSWSKKYKHLQRSGTPQEIAHRITDSMKNEYNPEGLFKHPSGSLQDLCFTGGEPLLKDAQECIVGVLEEFQRQVNTPDTVTFETNGTQPIVSNLRTFLWEQNLFTTFFSVSPKLFTTSGEQAKKAIRPETVAGYTKIPSSHGQLKFVVNGSVETWNELESAVKLFREHGVKYPVYIMPVGATEEGQNGVLPNYKTCGEIAEEAYKRGYSVSARVHVNLWGNKIGV